MFPNTLCVIFSFTDIGTRENAQVRSQYCLSSFTSERAYRRAEASWPLADP